MHAWSIFCLIIIAIIPVAGAITVYDHPITLSSALHQFHMNSTVKAPPTTPGSIAWNGVTVPVPQFLPPLTPVNLTPVRSPLMEFYRNADWNQTTDAGWDYMFGIKPLPRGVKWMNYPPSDWI